jgi:GLPGLI family protein
MKNMLPEFNTAKVQLSFNGTESTYKELTPESDVTEAEEGRERVVIRMGAENETYRNYASGKVIELRELGPRKYIIEDSIKKLPWRITGDSREIKGYNCLKAEYTTPEGRKVEAWYTDQIGCPGGPEAFGGLPGMILALSVGDGEIEFVAIEIMSQPALVKAPMKGKKISKNEFEKLLTEQYGQRRSEGPVIRIMRD